MKKAIIILAAALTACTQSPAPVSGEINIPSTKACVAEYDAEGFIGTREEYVAGCYRFAIRRF